MAQMTITSFMTGIKNWVLGKIGAITDLIPSQASSSNKLADKAFVNSSIATATATFQGTYNVVSDLSLSYNATHAQIQTALATKMSALSITPDNNDYAFVQIPTADATPTQIAKIEKYKYNGTAWAFEYELNNSGFTAAQWAAINSGITGTLVTKLGALPTNAELTTLLNGKADKSEMSVVAGTGANADKTTITLKTGTSATVLTTHQDISGKEDKTNKVTSITNESTDTQYGSAKAVYTFVMAAVNAIKEWANGIFAKIDGYYETMVVGTAKNLEGQNITEGTFFARPTGGESAELANGLAQLLSVKGRSVKYNQLVPDNKINFTNSLVDTRQSIMVHYQWYNGRTSISQVGIDGSIGVWKYVITAPSNATRFIVKHNGSKKDIPFFDTQEIVAGHKYYLRYTMVSNDDTVVGGIVVHNQTFIDLTALGIDNLTTVEQVEAWMAENWGTQEYYPYSEGAVINVNMTGIESFKKNLLNPTTGKAEIIGAYSEVYGNYYGICGTYGTITFKDAYGNESTITPDSDGKFELTVAGELTVADAGADCAVFLWWDGTETEYSEYGSYIAKLDIAHIYGKKNGTGELVRVWPTGMPAVGNVKDMLTIEGDAVVAKRKVGELDLGSGTWTKNTGYSMVRFQSWVITNGIQSESPSYNNKVYNAICSRYKIVATNTMISEGTEGLSIAMYGSSAISVKDSAFSDYTEVQFKNAMSGVMLYYEFATPETYTDLVYMGSELFEDGTPVTLPVNYEADNWGIEKVIPQNTSSAMLTAMPTIECKYSLDAVEQLDTHTAEIADLYDKNAQLNEQKANKIGEYPDMIVGSAAALKGDTAQSAEFVFRPSGSPDKVASGLAQMEAIKGKSLVWNQLQKTISSIQKSENGVTFELTNSKRTIKAVVTNVTALSYAYENTQTATSLTEGHIYLTRGCPKGGSLSTYFATNAIYSNYGNDYGDGYIFTADNSHLKFSADLTIKTGAEAGTYEYTPQLFDLTQMFGAGNEPATVAEFEKLYPLPYYAYNAGTIINNAATGLEVVGFNQWDEEWEVGYFYDNGGNIAYGGETTSTTCIRSKNYIPVFPSTNYFGKVGSGKLYRVAFFDKNYNYIGLVQNNSASLSFTTPSNAYYIKFHTEAYGNVYKNDICINLSDTAKNGTYEPYKKSTVELNIPTLTGKLNGEGESVTICADGMRGAGTAFDEGIVENGYLTKVVKRFGAVDLGTLNWEIPQNKTSFRSTGIVSDVVYISDNGIGKIICSRYKADTAANCFNSASNMICGISNQKKVYISDSAYSDAAAFKTAMDGVELIYELAEPQVYVLDTPIPVNYQVDGGGTERRLPEDTASEVNAPFAANIRYSMDAVGMLNNLPKDYDSAGGLDDLCSALATALGGALNGTLSIQRGAYNATTQKYAWTVTFAPNE